MPWSERSVPAKQLMLKKSRRRKFYKSDRGTLEATCLTRAIKRLRKAVGFEFKVKWCSQPICLVKQVGPSVPSSRQQD